MTVIDVSTHFETGRTGLYDSPLAELQEKTSARFIVGNIADCFASIGGTCPR